MNTIHKARMLQKRRWRIRKKVNGTAARPRLSVKFSTKHIYAQAIDDDNGATLVFLSSLDADLRKQKLAANLPPTPRPDSAPA
jgi:large subunit ribosomal protein L18